MIDKLAKQYTKYDFSETEFIHTYSPILVKCELHGVFSADAHEALSKHKLSCPKCDGQPEVKPRLIKSTLEILKNKYKEVLQLKTTDVAKVRAEIAKAQNNVCPLCERELDNPVLDHWHQKLNKGNGHVRLVLCRTCNSLLGKIENALPRYKIPFSLAPKWLWNVATYMTEGTTNLIHPTERRTIKLTRTEFNRLATIVKQYEKFTYSYPKNGILTKKLEELYNKYKEQL